MPDNIDWAEELPFNCPPEDAIRPNNSPFYRLVDTIPPTDKDFWSHRKLFPLQKYKVSDCMARSCSLIATVEQSFELLKLPTLKGKRIVKLILTPESGLIKQTGGHRVHYSWWRTRNFEPILVCVAVNIQTSNGSRT